jgi:hypothetical protein
VRSVALYAGAIVIGVTAGVIGLKFWESLLFSFLLSLTWCIIFLRLTKR